MNTSFYEVFYEVNKLVLKCVCVMCMHVCVLFKTIFCENMYILNVC